MSDEIGILAFGAYVPKRRLQRAAVYKAHAWFAPGLKGLAQGERAIANWDEDAITMAVEAGRDALTGLPREGVGSISLASTTLPFVDRLNAGVVKEALALKDEVSAYDVTGSMRAGTSSLVQALNAATAGRAPHLCIAAEVRTPQPASEAELVMGDAAAAMLVGSGAPVARHLGSHSVTVDFVDHFRAAGETFDYTWESRWIRDEGYLGIAASGVRAALEAFGVAAREIDHLAIAISARGAPEAIAKKLGAKSESVLDTLRAGVGDTGAAHPLLMLAAALEKAKPGEKILLVGFGQGVDVILFEATPALGRAGPQFGLAGSLRRRELDDNYIRALFHRNLLNLERGMRAEIDQKQAGTTLYRNRKTVLALVGGRCTKTGTVQFPKSDVSVNPNDHTIGTQEDYPLADRRACIVTFTADNLTFSPNPPNWYGVIDFEGGGRMIADFADVSPEDIEVGKEMRMVFRIKAIDERRHFARYFWKATTVD